MWYSSPVLLFRFFFFFSIRYNQVCLLVRLTSIAISTGHIGTQHQISFYCIRLWQSCFRDLTHSLWSMDQLLSFYLSLYRPLDFLRDYGPRHQPKKKLCVSVHSPLFLIVAKLDVLGFFTYAYVWNDCAPTFGSGPPECNVSFFPLLSSGFCWKCFYFYLGIVCFALDRISMNYCEGLIKQILDWAPSRSGNWYRKNDSSQLCVFVYSYRSW